MEAYKDKAWQRSMKLRLDINGMMADFVGEHGLSMADIEKNSAQYKRAAESMAAKRANMKWRELPHNQAEVVARIKTVAERVRNEYEAFVVLGIGGSALGPIAVQQALSHMRYNELSPRRVTYSVAKRRCSASFSRQYSHNAASAASATFIKNRSSCFCFSSALRFLMVCVLL